MKTFIINAARGVVSQKKKLDIKSKLIGREWRMLTDEQDIAAKYIFLKDGKLLISINGVSTYSQWQIATDSAIILDEGIATFLYKVAHIDDNLIVLNLDGTDSFCFLINDTSTSLTKATLEDIQWYLYRNCDMDILSLEQKHIVELERLKIEETERKEMEIKRKEEEEEQALVEKVCFGIMGVMAVIIVIALIISTLNK
ncbi:MAG: hypothetical protein K2L17_13565 [Muribaculaceae bacterium]|nr:hypothetical protein [Muribaculaceae bacterium]